MKVNHNESREKPQGFLRRTYNLFKKFTSFQTKPRHVKETVEENQKLKIITIPDKEILKWKIDKPANSKYCLQDKRDPSPRNDLNIPSTSNSSSSNKQKLY